MVFRVFLQALLARKPLVLGEPLRLLFVMIFALRGHHVGSSHLFMATLELFVFRLEFGIIRLLSAREKKVLQAFFQARPTSLKASSLSSADERALGGLVRQGLGW
jgi:hypothetical protein